MATPDLLREALITVASALKDVGRPFALTGGYGAWAHGAPEPVHDVDFLVAPEDAAAVAAGLAQAGLLVRQPSEDWLYKVEADGVTVDVIHRANQGPPAVLVARSTTVTVLSVELPVLDTTDLVAEQLLALEEHYCDYSGVLATLRALREKLDWEDLAARVEGRPFAEAALFLARQLGLVEEVGSGQRPVPHP